MPHFEPKFPALLLSSKRTLLGKSSASAADFSFTALSTTLESKPRLCESIFATERLAGCRQQQTDSGNVLMRYSRPTPRDPERSYPRSCQNRTHRRRNIRLAARGQLAGATINVKSTHLVAVGMGDKQQLAIGRQCEILGDGTSA